LCPVSFISQGKTVEVMQLLGGVSFLKKLKEMGILPGSILEVLQNNGGPVMLGLGNSRVALGQGIAKKIYVKEV